MLQPTTHRSRWLAGVGCGVAMLVLAACRPGSYPGGSAAPDVPAITFTRDVAPIIFAKCSGCHHPGEAAPFSLLTYDDVRRRATQIADVTQKGLMPPWLPKSTPHEFAGDRRLSDRELQILKQWVDAGAPLGNDADLPETPQFATDWQAEAPDLILESPAFSLPAAGNDVFRNFVVPLDLPSARWIKHIELRPENPRVTHHARLGIDRSNESIRRDAEDLEPGYDGMAWGQDPEGQLIIWAPGVNCRNAMPGVAWRAQPQTALVLHTHLQPSGKPEVVKFRIGIHFAAEPPTVHPVMLRVGSRDIDIPADEPNHVVTDRYTLPIDVDLHQVFPHAHSLCRSIKLVAVLPSGSHEELLSIERFDENWHEAYHFLKSLRLPRGTQLTTTFTYDNTQRNVRNRHRPPRRVAYGSNADDEMGDIYLQVTPAHPDQRAVLVESYKQYDLNSQLIGYQRTLELHPNDPWAQEALAACYVGLGKPTEAAAILKERVQASPNDVFPVASLGMALFAAGDLEQAETQLRTALSLDEKYPLAWLGLGKTLLAQKKSESAETAFRRALDLAPGLLEARLSLADLLIQSGRLDAAEQVCAAHLDASPDAAGVYLKLGEISVKRKQYESALDRFQSAQRLAPYTHPAKVLLAVYCFQNGDEATSHQMLCEAHRELPDHPVPTLYLGQLARRKKQADTANQYLTAATSQSLPESWPDSHRRRFRSLLHSERYQLAVLLRDPRLASEVVAQWQQDDPQSLLLRQVLNPNRAAAAP